MFQPPLLGRALQEAGAEGVVRGPPIHRMDKAQQVSAWCQQPPGVWPPRHTSRCAEDCRIKEELGRALTALMVVVVGRWGPVERGLPSWGHLPSGTLGRLEAGCNLPVG